MPIEREPGVKNRISARCLIAFLSAFGMTGALQAQEPAFLQGSAGVRYEEAPGVFHYVFPCSLPTAGGNAAGSGAQAASGSPALCWLAVVTHLEMVDGKPKGGAPVAGALMVSAERAHFLPNDPKAEQILPDFVPSQALFHYDAKHSVLGIQTRTGLFVLAFQAVCLGCTPGGPALDPNKAAQLEAEYTEIQSSMTNFASVSKRINDLAAQMRFGVTPKDQPATTDVPEAMALYSDLNHRLVPLCPEAARVCVQSYEKYQGCKSGNPQADCGTPPSCYAFCPLLADAWRGLKATFCRSPKLDYAALVPDWTPVALKMDAARAARGPIDPTKIHVVPAPAGAQPDFMGKPVDPDNPCSVESSYATAMMSHMTAAIGMLAPPPPGDAAGVDVGAVDGRNVKKIKVDGRVIAGNILVKTRPEYPAVAKAARIQGVVVLQAVISKDGTVESLQVLEGPPLLQQAALDAVKTWKYRPYLLNGEPVAVGTTINVVFALGG
jgi:TonB family protein